MRWKQSLIWLLFLNISKDKSENNCKKLQRRKLCRKHFFKYICFRTRFKAVSVCGNDIRQNVGSYELVSASFLCRAENRADWNIKSNKQDEREKKFENLYQQQNHWLLTSFEQSHFGQTLKYSPKTLRPWSSNMLVSSSTIKITTNFGWIKAILKVSELWMLPKLIAKEWQKCFVWHART